MVHCGNVLVWVALYDGGLCAQRMSTEPGEPVQSLSLCSRILQIELSCNRRIIYARTLYRVYVVAVAPKLRILDAFAARDVQTIAASRFESHLFALRTDDAYVVTGYEMDFERYDQQVMWSRQTHRLFPSSFRAVASLLAHGCVCKASPLHLLTADVFELIVSLLSAEY